MRLSSCLALLACLAAGSSVSPASADNHVAMTFLANILVDSATALCSVIKPTAPTQLHRAIKSPSDIVEQTVSRQNRISKEEFLILQDETDAQKFVEIIGGSVVAVEARMTERCPLGINSAPLSLAKAEKKRLLRHEAVAAADADTPIIKKIVDSGNPSNRIDVVFMGDGYTASEQTQFFADIQRLTLEMFNGDTFAQYLPLFNIWAAFLPSVDSGISIGSSSKNAVFGLYRGKDACDFPSVIANDDYYGGLGGGFAIATRSVTSGTTVLRHEMGHNFGKVGEEYDGGQLYSGANSAQTLESVPWKHWLTDPASLVEQNSVLLFHKHIWYDLQQGAYDVKFTSTGQYSHWYIRISVSGVDTDDSLSVMLDGKPLDWKSNGQKDRAFYTWSHSENGFSAGDHTLQVKAGGAFNSGPIIKQLCSVVIYEYKDESAFKLDDPEYIGIYPTFDINRKKTYRPDNSKCLMHNMQSTSFCSVCQENMWLQFHKRIDFIDELVVTGKKMCVKLIPLGQLRPESDNFIRSNPKVARAERYILQWLKNGQEVGKFRDQVEVDLTGEGEEGKWTLRAVVYTPVVRLDPERLMQSERTFSI